MQGFSGDFGTMPLGDVVLYLGNRELTGTLSIESGPRKKALAIKDGKACNAASNEPREYLGQFLINFGYISEEQLTKGFQVQAETKVLLGRIMVMIGAIDEETLRQVVAIKIRETVLEAFRWPTGTFRFARGVLPPAQDAVEVEVPLLDIHRESEFRDGAWASILQVFPQGNLTLQLDESRVPSDVAPGSLDGRLFQSIREGQTLNEMLLTLHATDFQLYQRVYALHRQGAVFPGQPMVERVETAGDAMNPDDMLNRARSMIAAGRVLDAEGLISKASELSPSREASELLAQTQANLTQSLRQFFLTGRRVPHLTLEPARLRAMELSPSEKYLLSRIDGVRDVKTIVRVSPVRELDALKSFQRFLDTGLVRVE